MLGGAWRPHCRGGLVITDGGVPVAAVGCCASAETGASAAAPSAPPTPLTNPRRDGAERMATFLVMSVSSRLIGGFRYFQLLRKKRGSSSGYGLKLSCFDKP